MNNVVCLPYQPLERLAGSLSAADVQVVVMGDPFVGTIHPCKIYNSIAVGAPILYIGPEPSHVSEALAELDKLKTGVCRAARHGDAGAVVEQIQAAARTRERLNAEQVSAAAARFSKSALLPQMVAVLEEKR